MKDDKKHTYEYAVDLVSDTAPARVIRMVGKNRRVLEIGAGPGSITKHLKHANACKVTALELDSEAIKKLSPYCECVYQGNLNDPSWPNLLNNEGKFDVIVAADVLEHLYDPLTVLKQMSEFMNPNGCIIISLPHVGHSAIHACLMDENFEYRDWGLLDRTHIRFFGMKNIQLLFEEAGLKIVEAEFVVRTSEQTEFADKWNMLDAELKRQLSKNPFGLVYQVVVKAVASTASNTAISLLSMKPEHIKQRRSLKGFAQSRLSKRTKSRLKTLLRLLGIRV